MKGLNQGFEKLVEKYLHVYLSFLFGVMSLVRSLISQEAHTITVFVDVLQ